jgi:hypothetical protein
MTDGLKFSARRRHGRREKPPKRLPERSKLERKKKLREQSKPERKRKKRDEQRKINLGKRSANMQLRKRRQKRKGGPEKPEHRQLSRHR